MAGAGLVVGTGITIPGATTATTVTTDIAADTATRDTVEGTEVRAGAEAVGPMEAIIMPVREPTPGAAMSIAAEATGEVTWGDFEAGVAADLVAATVAVGSAAVAEDSTAAAEVTVGTGNPALDRYGSQNGGCPLGQPLLFCTDLY